MILDDTFNLVCGNFWKLLAEVRDRQIAYDQVSLL